MSRVLVLFEFLDPALVGHLRGGCELRSLFTRAGVENLFEFIAGGCDIDRITFREGT